MSDTGSAAGGFENRSEQEKVSHGEKRGERQSVWHRLGYMIGFAFAAYLSFWALIVLTVMQFIFILSSGTGNVELKRFSGQLAGFMKEAIDFVTFQSDDRPFPFKPFPSSEDKN